MKKRINKSRGKQRKKIVKEMQSRLLAKLDELAKGLTYREKVKAHVAFYEECNLAEKEFLFKVFEEQEYRDLTQLAY